MTLCIGYVLSWFPFARKSLGLTPGLALPVRAFTFVTYAYLPASLPSLLATAPLSTYLTHVLDPIQGHKGLALIVLVTVGVAGLATWLTVWLTYVLASIFSTVAAEAMVNVLYTPICGFYAGTVGLLVALKQAVPGDMTVRGVTVRTSVLPVGYVGAVCLGQLVWGKMVHCLVVMYGLVAAWMWLRYLHPVSGVAGLVGDPSDQFKLLSFMPDALQRHAGMNAFSDQLDVRMRAWAAQAKDIRGVVDAVRKVGVRGREGAVATEGVCEEDAVRRRERGMKSLEARLGGVGGGAKNEQDEQDEVGKGDSQV